MGLLLCCIGAAACGRVRFDALRDSSANVVSDSIPPCTSFSPWSTPRELTELHDAIDRGGSDWEFGAQVMPDGLTLYFDRHNASYDELFVAHRPDRNSMFGSVQSLGIGTSNGDCCATLTADELELYFERPTGPCIHSATRTCPTCAWGPATAVTALCASSTEGAYITPTTGLALYYSTNNGTDTGTLMMTTRASRTVPFNSTGAAVPGLAMNPTKGYPVLSGDDPTAIYFESGSRLYQSAWSAANQQFDPPTQLPTVINFASRQQDVSITADGLELFFSAGAAVQMVHVYVATRTCL